MKGYRTTPSTTKGSSFQPHPGQCHYFGSPRTLKKENNHQRDVRYIL